MASSDVPRDSVSPAKGSRLAPGRTALTAEATFEKATEDPRLGVKIHVAFLGGDKPFYGGMLPDVCTFRGIDDYAKPFSFSMTLFGEVTDLHCKGNATK